MSAPARRRIIRVETDGQVTLPTDRREKLGLMQGGLVSVIETPDGLLFTNESLIADHDLELVDAELSKQGLSLAELIDSGREIRGELLKEMYGRDG